MKKKLLLSLILTSLVAQANMVGKISYNLGFPIELRTNEMSTKEYVFTNGDKKQKITLSKPADIDIDAFRIGKALEFTAIDTQVKFDLGWDNAPIVYGFELGTQKYTYLPNNIETVYATSFLKNLKNEETQKKYLANAYVGYKNSDIFLKPELRFTYYLTPKKNPFFTEVDANILDIYQSIYHETDNGWRINQSLDLKTKLKTVEEDEKYKFQASFETAEFIVGASNFIGKDLLFKGRLKFIYDNNLKIDDIQKVMSGKNSQKVMRGKSYYKLLKPMSYDKSKETTLENINNSTINDKEAVGHSSRLLVTDIRDMYLPKLGNPTNGAYTDPKAPLTNVIKENKIKYNIEFQPRIILESHKNKSIKPSISIESRINDSRYMEIKEIKKFTDEELAKIREYQKANGDTKNLQNSSNVNSVKDYHKSRFRLIVTPGIKYTGIEGLYLTAGLRTEFDYEKYSITNTAFNKDNNKYIEKSSYNKSDSLIIVINPNVELDYTTTIKPGIKFTQKGYASYQLKMLGNLKGEFKTVDKNGEWKDSGKTFTTDYNGKYKMEIYKTDEKGRVFLKIAPNTPRDISDLTYNEVGDQYGKNLVKEVITNEVKPTISQNILLAGDSTFTFDVVSGFNIDLGITGRLLFENTDYSKLKLKNIQIVPHLGLNYEF